MKPPALPWFVPRAAALLVLLVSLAVAWGLVVAPALRLVFSGDAGVAAAATELRGLKAMVRAKPAMAARLAAMTHELSVTPVLWRQPSAIDISAAAQARLRDMAGAAGGVVRSAADMPAEPVPGLTHVRLRADMLLPVNTLAESLARLESGAPALFIDTLHVDAGLAGSDQAPMATVTLVLSAYGMAAP